MAQHAAAGCGLRPSCYDTTIYIHSSLHAPRGSEALQPTSAARQRRKACQLRQRHVRGQRIATLAGKAAGPGPEDDEEFNSNISLRQQAAKLDALFYKPSSEPAAGEEDAGSASLDQGRSAAEAPQGAGALPDLPLWRVQWATLPGTQEVLHVHVPHYCHMFEKIMAGPRPWRFGHVYLPGGSEALGTPAAAIAPLQSASRPRQPSEDPFEDVGGGSGGASAPAVGVLMELVSAVRCPDGRLIVLAYGVGRLRVERVVVETPFTVAHCRLAPDAEEVAAAEGLAEHALEGAPPDAPLLSAMAAASAAAGAAAIAAAQVWQRWELEAVLARGAGVRDASKDAEGMAALRRIELAGGVADVVRGSAAGQRGLGEVRVAAAEAAREAALAAAAQAWTQDAPAAADVLQDPERRPRGTTFQRDVPSRGADEGVVRETQAAAAAALDGGDADIATVQQAELGLWMELDTVVTLAARLRLRPLALPQGLLALRPPPGGEGGSAFGSDGSGVQPGEVAATAAAPAGSSGNGRGSPVWDAIDEATSTEDSSGSGDEDGGVGFCPPEYPALRRAQRLSFTMPVILPDISTSEGRQALLEARGTVARLGLLQTALRKHRKVLAALASLKGLGD